MVERIGELVREKKIDGVPSCADESDRHGYRVVVELKREQCPTSSSTSSTATLRCSRPSAPTWLALEGGRPLVMNLKDLPAVLPRVPRGGDLAADQVPARQARDRAHVLVGLAIAVANIDEIIRLIRTSHDANEAREPDWDATGRPATSRP